MAPARDDNSIPVFHRILICLRFLGTGDHFETIADAVDHPTTKTSVCRFVQRFIKAVRRLQNLFIQFPSTKQRRQLISQRYDLYRIKIYIKQIFFVKKN